VRGASSEALGRSRGGFSTKIHIKVALDGLPLAFHLTPGQASDSRQFEILLDLGPDIAPRAAVGDKGYDAKANRAAARKRGICPVIPVKSSAKERPAFFPKALYRARARIEQLMGKLKRFKRIALRCEKTHRNFGSFVARTRPDHSQIRPHGLATSAASAGVSSPDATASKRANEARGTSAAVSIAGRAKVTGRSRLGGQSRSRHSRRATVSPLFAISIALRVMASASPSRRASIASVALFRAPFGRPGLPARKGAGSGDRGRAQPGG